MFRPLEILEDKNSYSSVLAIADLQSIRQNFRFPDCAIIRLLLENKRMDWVCTGWMVYYGYPFAKLGHKFPFFPLSFASFSLLQT